MHLPSLLRVATALGVCAPASTAAASETTTAVIAGTPVGSRDRSVVALADSLGTIYCTGTLVSPRIVLTAAHCLGKTPALVFVGTDSSRDGVFIEVAGSLAHPESRGAAEADLAIVWLGRSAPLEPTVINVDVMNEADLGSTLRFVGFGATGTYDTGVYGIKHTGTTALTSIDEAWLGYGVAGCHGDSGGPAFLSRDGGEVLAGITSHGDADCAIGGFSTRVDRYASWIVDRIAELDPPACELDGRCAAGCANTDLDCAIDASLDEPVTGSGPIEGPLDTTGCSTGHASSGSIVLVVLALLQRRRRSAVVGLVLALASSGCTTEPPSDGERTFCRTRPIGDATRPPEIELLAISGDYDRRPLHDNSVLELDDAPARFGVRARGVDGCSLAVRIVAQPISAPDLRIGAGTVLELEAEGAWGAPPIAASSWMELSLLPGREYRLVVGVEDANGTTGMTSMHIAVR